jgi:hypothetical protein
MFAAPFLISTAPARSDDTNRYGGPVEIEKVRADIDVYVRTGEGWPRRGKIRVEHSLEELYQ